MTIIIFYSVPKMQDHHIFIIKIVTVLLAICDIKYIFTFVNIGAYGRRSDSGIFKDSLLSMKCVNNEMNVPDPEPLYFERNLYLTYLLEIKLFLLLNI